MNLPKALERALVSYISANDAAATKPLRTPQQIRNFREFVQNATASPDSYVSCRVVNQDVTNLTIALRREDDFGHQTAMVIPFIWRDRCPRRSEAEAELAAIAEHFRHVRGKQKPLDQVSVFLFSGQKAEMRLLRRMGFAPDSYELIGEVDEGLSYLQRIGYELPDGYRFCVMSYKKDIERVLRLERISHSREPTSRVRLSSRRAVEKMRDFYREVNRGDNRVYLIEKGRRLVGLIAFFCRGTEGAIGSITVHPDHQGLGLSYALYAQALGDMRKRKCRYYHGGTTTDKVLGFASKLQRRVNGVLFTRKIEP